MTIKELFEKAGAKLPDGYHFCVCVFEKCAPIDDKYDRYTRGALIAIVTEHPKDEDGFGGDRAACPLSYVEPFADFSPWQMEREYLVIPGDVGDVDAKVFRKSLPYCLQDLLRSSEEGQ